MAEKGTSRLATIAARVDALSVRERGLGFVILVALAWGAWDTFLISPLDARRAALQERAPRVEADIASLNRSAELLAAERNRDPDADPRQRLEKLRGEREQVGAQLLALTSRLVSPKNMSRVLERVLTRETALTLTRLEGLGAQRVTVASMPVVSLGVGSNEEGTEGTRSGVASLYRHGLRIEFEGAYLDTLAYLRALESLESGFLWQALEFEVLEYPRAGVAITVQSLSLEDAWIGI